jgi:hypothetical protein
MPSLYTEIEINAPKSAVWQALLHKEHWSQWNTFLFDRSVTQPFQQGQPVSLSLRRLNAESETEFQPIVTLVQPEVCLRWVTAAPGFKNEHVFELQDVGWQRTKYTHQENFSGLLTPIFLAFIRHDEQQGLRRMARELKQYVESG